MKTPSFNAKSQSREAAKQLSVFTFAPLLLCAFAFCSCSKPDPRITQQQTQITHLNQRLDLLSDQLDAALKANATTLASVTNLEGWVKINSDMLVQDNQEIADLEAAAAQWRTNHPSTRAPARLLPRIDPETGQTIMPADVAAQIRADAERRYPTDYEMQAFVIKEQTEAWHKLNP
jgi:septal ring factor EnvC (AmiA/AmiB activator)